MSTMLPIGGIILIMLAAFIQLYSVLLCLNAAQKGRHVSQVYILPLFFWYAGASIYGKPLLLNNRWSEFLIVIGLHLFISIATDRICKRLIDR
jgi:hypothetical protein